MQSDTCFHLLHLSPASPDDTEVPHSLQCSFQGLSPLCPWIQIYGFQVAVFTTILKDIYCFYLQVKALVQRSQIQNVLLYRLDWKKNAPPVCLCLPGTAHSGLKQSYLAPKISISEFTFHRCWCQSSKESMWIFQDPMACFWQRLVRDFSCPEFLVHCVLLP